MSPLEIFKADQDKQLQIYLDDPELNECAAIAWSEFDKMQGSAWIIGEQLFLARNKIECNVLYGRWRSAKFAGHSPRTLDNYRYMHKAFGSKQKEVAFLPVSSLYELAAPKIEDNRLAILDDLKEIKAEKYKDTEVISGKLVKEVIEKYCPQPPKVKEVKDPIVQEVTHHPKKESEQVKPTAGGLNLTNEEIVLGKMLFNTCFDTEIKKYPTRYNMETFASLKDKFTALYNSL